MLIVCQDTGIMVNQKGKFRRKRRHTLIKDPNKKGMKRGRLQHESVGFERMFFVTVILLSFENHVMA
jgi:hypothetical protein